MGDYQKNYLAGLVTGSHGKVSDSLKLLGELQLPQRELLDAALIELYRFATCNYACKGGEHIVERLSGRGYNQAVSAIHLMSLGFYDEALTLVRSMGELNNLLTLLVSDDESSSRWLQEPPEVLRHEFSPAKVRKKLKAIGHPAIPMSEETYWALSGEYVHPGPRVTPNGYTNDSRGRVGGPIQPEGFTKCANAIEGQTVVLALTAAHALGFEEQYERLKAMVSALTPR